MIIYGKRTHHTTEVTKSVKLFVEFRYAASLSKWYLHLVECGVTGYESISVSGLQKVEDGWYACAGTKGRWDTLYIEQKWINIIRKGYVLELAQYRKLPNNIRIA